jgi:hypothetical protein
MRYEAIERRALVRRNLWPRAAGETTLRDMAATKLKTGAILQPEIEAARQRRIAREAEMIAEADAELDAGLYVDWAEMEAWFDSIGTDHELPPPPARQR